MDRETALQTIRSEWRTIIAGMTQPAKQKANGETSYICPICGHGKGGDGLTVNPKSKDGNGLKCFGCDFSGDILDLYQRTTGKDFNAALSLLAGELGITIDPYRPEAAADFAPVQNARQSRTEAPQREQNGLADKVYSEKKSPAEGAEMGAALMMDETADYTAYYRECMARLNDPAAVAYLQKRGISTATAEAYNLGFDPAADPASAPGATGNEYKPHPAARIIIPTTRAHYIGRAIDPNNQYPKLNPSRNKGAGAAGIFNSSVLYAQDVHEIFVTEGAFDALSILEVGAAAVALNSTSNADLLLKQLEERPTAATLILCLDNDPAGQKAIPVLRQGLQRLNVSHITADICGTCKDPNEHLTQNRGEFAEAVQRAQDQTAARPDGVGLYIDSLMAAEIDRFKVETMTGFENLDKLAGGLYSGLYVLAAISSLGKTSFALQMADQICTAGHDVIFFSLEQSRLELVSKCIARRTYQNNPAGAVTSLSIRKGYLPAQVQRAAAQLKQEVQNRFSIIEGNFNCNLSFMGEYIRQYIRNARTDAGKRPVVFVDYLQVLQPEQLPNGRQQSTKETVDSTVTALKRLSRELDLTIIAISSVNRANYLTPIDFESLKESGSIEYTADCVWGLQLQCLNDPMFDKRDNIKQLREKVKAAKAADPRKIELVCLKNRYGKTGESAFFKYYPANDLFTPCSDAELDFSPTAAPRKAGHKTR